MYKNLKFVYAKDELKALKSNLFITALSKNEKINKTLDALFNSKLSKTIFLENFKGEKKKCLYLYGNSDIKRIYIVGLGNKKDISSDDIRSFFADFIRLANQKKN